ncbi:hypothetical protein BJP34_05995 [Moorena producens PAL-8-15-08-1]|uniref:Transposase n=1 Tax=Moorena producens PAL-8-15-08-1 TaxID=1458985 RepID=A0A1D8TN63_9CYAN|nr:hypothetical protein BJP34_05995 [Moorena producens PAL-8-15-08-1]
MLLIALAYTRSILIGNRLKHQGLQKYINRLTEPRRFIKRHSNFWVGLYGQNWIISLDYCWQLVEKLVDIPTSFPIIKGG